MLRQTKIVVVILFLLLCAGCSRDEKSLVVVSCDYLRITRTDIRRPKAFVIRRVFHTRWLHAISELLVHCSALTRFLTSKPSLVIIVAIMSLRKSLVPASPFSRRLFIGLQFLPLYSHIGCFLDAILIKWFGNIYYR